MKFICINLKRRTDRRNEMTKIFDEQNIPVEFYNAVDGQKIKADEGILNLFKHNDFGYRRGVIGCALSHIDIWTKLAQDSEHRHYVVLEDDIQIAKGFMKKINWIERKMRTQHIGLVYLGSNMNHAELVDVPNKDMKLLDFPFDNWGGGTYDYIIFDWVAKQLLTYIQCYAVQRAIDWVMVDACMRLKMQDLLIFNVKLLRDPIVKTNVALLDNEIDSDIQRDMSTLI